MSLRRTLVVVLSCGLLASGGSAVAAPADLLPGLSTYASCMGGDSSVFGFYGSTKDRDFRSHIVKEVADAEGVSPGFFHSSNARDC